MITPGMIYLIGMLDNISEALVPILMFSLMFLMIGVAAWVTNIDENKRISNFGKRAATIALTVLLVSGFIKILLPSTKLAAAMYVVPVIVNNEDVKAIGGNSLEVLRKLTEQWLLELNGKNKACGHEHNL